MKVLVFTCSYMRPYMLRQCILNIKNQTYKNSIHSINITLDENEFENNKYQVLYDDLIDDKLIINYSKNTNQYMNHIHSIKSVKDFDSYDLFIKLDDDDIYKSKYIETIVNVFENNKDVDIVSSGINNLINGNKLIKGVVFSLGGNPVGTDFNMPMTFAFNKKGLNSILNYNENDFDLFEDFTWRYKWAKSNLNHKTINNNDNIIWHIHGKNMSTSSHFIPF